MRDRLIITMLWATGMRVSELINIKITDINFDEGTIIIRALKKKGEIYRKIPVGWQAMEMIRKYLAQHKSASPRLFPISRQMVYWIVRNAGNLAGITQVGDPNISKYIHLHPQTLRHSFAMNWFEQGGSPERLQKLLWHSSYDVTVGYLRFSIKDLRKEYDKIMG